MMSLERLTQAVADEARKFSTAPLMARPDGTVATLRDGYIPLLVNFTFEDKAAKGLRKLKDQAEPEPPVYFSALEMARDHEALLLVGETGSGKTTFARALVSRLAGEAAFSPSVPRNEDGTRHDETWEGESVHPLIVTVVAGADLASLLRNALPEIESLLASAEWQHSGAQLLIILDGLEAAGAGAFRLLEEAAGFQARNPRIRLLALAESGASTGLVPPAPFVRFALLPLLKAQRIDAGQRLAGLDLSANGRGLGAAAANPAQFAMALTAHDEGRTPEEITDNWLSRIAGDPQSANLLCGLAYDGLIGKLDDPELLPVTRIRQLLAARHLAGMPEQAAMEPLHQNPALLAPVIRSLAARLSGTEKAARLVEALLQGSGEARLRGALLAAEWEVEEDQRRCLADHLLTIVETGSLTPAERERAGRYLSAFGDPRDLQALADVPGGTFTMGAQTHPNSAPPHPVTVAAFRIGLYPVTNAAYAAFVRATERFWQSPDGFAPDRQSAPATDLTWRDANAYCAWLTDCWRREGRIGQDEMVRLPTEPEWERAARGDQADAANAILYPWGLEWRDDASNSEEAGFNTTCTVGLFPKGRSPYGCFDMTGQVWEWCSTLWGTDMTTPSFAYPYREDGREDPAADAATRRVLRGGCFSSGKLKACCTYRGSLEPDGFWRGNGFRIVVAKI
ncbi:SUMF1/EgtB/PvdO family nonheme iron enzyme [Rhizobium sp. SSA_523]|uniref:formylglycine-generating enzyme family protein n=1 Tax=Rhizobium sp. SSA_523 TaxID=2952477 RepID=UPI0020900506|nr:SUMF1/EgtB/PvdO family nonheme iron enzyme [Rhizobium sp. SSA_523]MCO5732229.1 SUMF1/EgtB/PvdO family nonheme iron enzyme [Rhizobium sp. SSA_523]WKC21360.1 SUMF1/EgtB/PvdO family nonheme iron enzyme [Rhizobium sp. SSA_523]